MSVPDYKINYKSDFVLTINGDAGWAVPFCIKFWTGMPSQAYFVGFDGVKYVNCKVGDTPTQLLVMFDDHHLPIGPLRMQIAYHTTIEEFPGSVFDEVTNARDVIVTIDGTDYQVLLDFTGEDAPELEFDLPAYANEAERIQNELQRQQNEADRIAAELQREQATAAAVQGAENVNAQLNGTILTVTNRQGVSTSVNTKGEQGEQGPVGPEGPQGEQGAKGEKGDTGATGPQGVQGPAGPQGQTGVSITDFVKTGETETDTLYDIEFSDDTTKPVAIPKGEKGDQGEQGPEGPQGPMGDVAVITPEQQTAFTMYSETGQNTNGPMTQKAVTDALNNIAASGVSYDNSHSGLAANNVQGALDEQSEEFTELVADVKTAGLPELSGTQIQNLYIDHTTGVVKSNTTQRSYKYAVNKGDYIVYNYRCDASYSQRYGFIAGEPAVDVKAYDYGVHLSRTSGVDIMRAPVNGYFLVSNGGSVYPVCNVMGVSSKLFKYEEHSNIFTHKGYLNSSDGTIKSSSSYVYSNKIKVQEGDVVTVIGGGTYNISTIVMYGSNDSIISYSAPPTTTVCTTIKVIPSGVSYIRACTKLTALSISKILVIRKISDELDKIRDDIYGLDVKNEEFYTGFYYLADGSFCAANQVSNRKMSDIHLVVEGEVLEYRLDNTSSTLSLCAFDSNLDLVLASSLVGNTSSPEGEYTVPQGISYVMGVKTPGSVGYIRSKNRGIFPQIKVLETQLNNISETDILLNRVGVTTKIYTDHTTGVVTTSDSQRGYLYEVKGGDVIKIVDSDLTNNHRYGFFSAYPNIGSQALSYGLEHSDKTILTAPTGSMYLMINNNASYPPVTLYLQGSPSSSATRIAEYSDVLRVFKGERKYIYGYKYNIDINYLGTRSDATLADGVLSVSSGGSAQSAYDLYDDEVRMSCKIKPTSDTFDIRFGRYNTTNGTLIGLRKDSNGSFLDLYYATTLAASYEFPFSLANNVEYCVNLTKFTLDNTYIDIAIISNDGRSYHLLVGTPEYSGSIVGADVVHQIGKLWGKVYLASSSGSFEAYSFNMYSPYKQDCQVAVIGHSFVEGNSVEGMKLKKFSKLLQRELGIKECGVYGRGGGTMSQSLDVLQHYVGVFHTPKYVLLCVGTNDNSMTLANWKTWANNVIGACGAINATPVFFTIPPDSGAYEGQWNSINAFIRTSGYKYVDMDKCFVDGSGNPILSDYLYDGTHPNPETHYAIFQRILADVPEILDLWSQ